MALHSSLRMCSSICESPGRRPIGISIRLPRTPRDIAETKRLRQTMMDAQAKLAADAQAGRSYQAMQADMFVATPAQQAVMNRGDALLSGRVADMLAANAGMPESQWNALHTAVETAAGLHEEDRFGSGEEGSATLTPEQRERAAKITKRLADNRRLVALDAPEIKRLADESKRLIAAALRRHEPGRSSRRRHPRRSWTRSCLRVFSS